MTKLTSKYIKEHQHAVHTYESFARGLAEQLLKAAEKQAGETGVDKVSIPATFEIAAYEPLSCIRICGEIGGVVVCYHVNM